MSHFAVVIPARYASERLPGKPLRVIADKTMLEHVWARAMEGGAAEVVVATDDERIASVADAFGATTCMTAASHQSGTDRIAEVVNQLGWDDSQIVVNLQGDEPMMPPSLIAQCAALLDDPLADIATLASPLASRDDLLCPDIVKVVVDEQQFALLFSRAAIPYSRAADTDQLAVATALHHHGLYAYRCSVLRRLVATPPSAIERCERLEQLRAMSLGLRIKVGVPDQKPGPGVDTEVDLSNVAKLLAERGD